MQSIRRECITIRTAAGAYGVVVRLFITYCNLCPDCAPRLRQDCDCGKRQARVIKHCLSHSHAHTCKHATHMHIHTRPHMHAHAHMHTHRLTHAHTCTPPMEQLANHRPCFCHRAMANHGAAHYISTAALTMYNSATADECAPRLRAHVLRDCGH